jgi:hypothetical protein
MPLQISLDAARYAADPDQRARFRKQHWIRLPAVFDEAVLARLNAALRAAAFTEVRHAQAAAHSSDLRVLGAAASELLVLLCNDPAVLRAIEDVTGCGPLTRFNGSIYRMLPDARHRQDWHDDVVDGRCVTLTVNISAAEYVGGALEIRERGSRNTIARIENPVAGDGVLFRLDRAFEHRVLPVKTGVKTAFAGWFRRGTTLRDELRGAV